jgi:hypothetical protein
LNSAFHFAVIAVYFLLIYLIEKKDLKRPVM